MRERVDIIVVLGHGELFQLLQERRRPAHGVSRVLAALGQPDVPQLQSRRGLMRAGHLVGVAGVVPDGGDACEPQVLQQALARSLCLDEHAVGAASGAQAVLHGRAAVLGLPVLDRAGAQVGVRQVFVPRINDHHVSLPTEREHRVHAACRGVAAGLLSERAVVALQDVFELRQRLCGGPELYELCLQDAALGGLGVLLELARRAVDAEQLLQVGDLLGAEAVWADQLAHLLARVVRSEERLARHPVPLGGDHQVFPPANVLENVAADVLFVQALHDRDHGVTLRIVQPRRPHHVEPLQRRLAHHVGLRLLGRVWVVEQEP